jgi:hypothetical protein
MTEDDIRDDLAYVKALAEEGRDTPLVGGSFYVLWGGVIGVATLLSWLNAIDVIALGGLQLYMWIGAFALGWGLSFVLGSRSASKPGATTLGNTTARSVWFAVGVFMTLFWVTLMFAHDNFTAYGVPPYFLFNLMFPIAFGLYGVAFYATATAARVRWLKWVALLAFVFSVLSLFFMTTAHQPLIALLGLVSCAIVPGIVLMRGEPSEVV